MEMPVNLKKLWRQISKPPCGELLCFDVCHMNVYDQTNESDGSLMWTQTSEMIGTVSKCDAHVYDCKIHMYEIVQCLQSGQLSLTMLYIGRVEYFAEVSISTI